MVSGAVATVRARREMGGVISRLALAALALAGRAGRAGRADRD